VWIVDHGWHTSLVVRASDVAGDAWPERRDFPAARYLEVAWGDRDFYVAPRGTSGLALRAATVSRGSVLHVVGFSDPVGVYFAAREVVEVALSRHPAGGRYSLLNTCNTWIASALRAAGSPITPLWTPTAAGVLRQVRSFGRVVPSGL
jgi:hypothetical protein